MVWVCKNWEKDGKGNETNLGLFGHLLPAKFATYHPPPREYVSPVSLLSSPTNVEGLDEAEHPSTVHR